MAELFTKRQPGAPRGMFAWEARGLRWLGDAAADGGAPVVRVVGWDDEQIQEERLQPTAPTVEAAEQFGHRLALTHLTGVGSGSPPPAVGGFGAPPPGWSGDGFIGQARLPMPSHPLESWGAFYAQFRLQPFARQAFDAGSLSPQALSAVEAVCRRLMAGDFDDDRPAARIHGDLWAGNVLFTPNGVVLIDPAAHGGHAETDLAMLALFGAPHLERIRDAWAEVYCPAPGWQDRVALHQLHPVLVHAVLFGGGYGRRAGELASACL
ncbi:fructosamine kinase family protein [Luteococcus sp. Sow4_B9]|uniref:fructosamine kinase family protein n=1 Tax=Luteococcus sp. Sow4_B9 TaxID=3438792 RepID=UPI003F98EB7C